MESSLPGNVCRPRQPGEERENPRARWSGPLGFLMLPGLQTIATVLGMGPLAQVKG